MTLIVRNAAVPCLLMLLALPAEGQTLSSLPATSEAASQSLRTSMLSRRAKLFVEDVTLEAGLTRLYESSGVPVAFSPSYLPPNHRVSCHCDSATVGEALETLLRGTPLHHNESGNQVVIEPLEAPIPAPVDILRPTPATLVSMPLYRRAGSARTTTPGREVRTGTITGRVVDSATRQPLASVQVVLSDAGIGALTDTNGRYTLSNVPAGPVTIRVQMIGYSPSQRQVTVTDGAVVTADFDLSVQALALDEVIVTGTAGGQQRRAIGNVVERVDASRIVEVAPVVTVQQLLGSRMAGVIIQAPVAQVGAGQSIQVRGRASLSLSGDPIVYIDGVRANSSLGGPSVRGGSNISRLNDLNPEDIERIEVIKGPSAATLYGTEAANGVIQIITKRGRPGTTQFNFGYKLGANWLQDPAGRTGLSYYTNDQGEIESFNLYLHEKEFGRGEVFSTGLSHLFNGSMSGGTDQIRYFLSADYADETGVVPENWNRKFTGRMNVGLMPADELSINTSIGYTNQNTRQIQGEIATDVYSQLVWGSPASRNTPQRGFLFAPPEALATPENLGSVNRVTASLEIGYKPLDWLSQRLVVGVDIGEEEDSKLFPRTPEGEINWFSARGLGDKTIGRDHVTFVTTDYAGTISRALTERINGSFSFGFQYYRRSARALTVAGSLFPAPPVTTVDGAATTRGSESFTENATVGVYLQQEFEWNNRLFLTAAVRGDDNSAFGANYDAAIYPKLSGTWMAIEERPLGPLTQLRLRAAWGKAGQQPGTNAAVRLYNPVTGPGGTSAVTPGAYGNPDLKPEVGVELEMGFDAALFDDRLSLLVTRYSRTTKDAIVQNPLAPSSGFSGSQSVNVGEVKGWGTEVALDARLVEASRMSVSLGGTFGRMGTEVVSLGGVEFSNVFEGYPLGIFLSRKVVSAELSNGAAINALCDGGTGRGGIAMGGEPVPCASAPAVYWGRTDPSWQGSLNSTVTLFDRLRLFASVEALGGNVRSESTVPAGHTSYCMTLACQLRDDPIFLAYLAVDRNPTGFYKAGFAKLREVSATYSLSPAMAARIGASSASVSLAGRNLATLWLENEDGLNLPYGGNIWDPEYGGQTVLPPMANLLMSFRVAF